MDDELHPVDHAQNVEREIDQQIAWQEEAKAEHAEWLDYLRTMEDARY